MTPDPPIKPSDRLGNIISAIAKERGAKKEGYSLSKATLDKKVDPTLTCIGGACDVYRAAGFEFPELPGFIKADKPAVGGDFLTEYNPSFAASYDKAGFDKIEVTDKEQMKSMSKLLKKGDMVQYWDDQKPYHTNLVTDINDDGSYNVFNNYALSSGEESLYKIFPQDAKNAKTVIYRAKDETAAKALEKGSDVAKTYESKEKRSKFLGSWNERNIVPSMDSYTMVIKNKKGETLDTGIAIDEWQSKDSIEKNRIINSVVMDTYKRL